MKFDSMDLISHVEMCSDKIALGLNSCFHHEAMNVEFRLGHESNHQFSLGL